MAVETDFVIEAMVMGDFVIVVVVAGVLEAEVLENFVARKQMKNDSHLRKKASVQSQDQLLMPVGPVLVECDTVCSDAVTIFPFQHLQRILI